MHNHSLGRVYYASLPVAGVNGPIKNRMVDTAAQGNLRGKTGYLGMVSSLSGYVTSKDGKLLVFAIIVNNHLNPEGDALKIEDKIGQLLAN